MNPSSPLDLANASGYLLQLAVLDVVRQHPGQYGWRELVSEHPWSEAAGASDGFIDFVLHNGHGPLRMVVEAKRVKSGTWLFLQPAVDSTPDRRLRCLWTKARHHEPAVAGWHDFQIAPPSPTAQFCVVRGTGEDTGPFLERHIRKLLTSLDRFADEEIDVANRAHEFDPRFYFPLIITNATLAICRFVPTSVSLASGTLEASDAEIAVVPYVRFHKTLAVSDSSARRARTIRDASKAKERTVLIVNSEHFADLLDALQFDSPRPPVPWEASDALERDTHV